MSSGNFSILINEFPEEREAIERLLLLLCQAAEKRNAIGGTPEWTVQRLFDIAHPSSQRALARILSRLVEKGLLRQIIRVESDTRGGLGDFQSLEEIPLTVFDTFLGHDVDVSMDRLRTIYSIGRTVEVECQRP